MYETIPTGKPVDRPPTRYDDAEYSHILDGIVFACADIVILNQHGEMLTAKRTYEPALNVFWIIGGRMRFGESFQQAAARNLRREMKIDLNPARFTPFTTHNYVWGVRNQEPVENGSHNVSIIHVVTLTPQEIEELQPNEEYTPETMIWRNIEKIANSTTDHPAIVQTAKDLIKFLRTSQS